MRFLSEIGKLSLLQVGAFLFGIAAIGVLIHFCGHDELLWLEALTGAVIGWIVGMLAAPYTDDERQQFGELAKVISGFITGYVLSKVDPVIAVLVKVPASGGDPRILQNYQGLQILVTLSSFCIAVVFVFSARRYWSGQYKALREWIEKQPNKNMTQSEAIEKLVEQSGS